jgi:MipA family protein
MKKFHNACALAATLALTSTWVGAQDIPMPGPESTDGSAQWTLGLGLQHGPAYLGSDENKTRALPIVSVRWGQGWFAGTTGIGYQLAGSGPLNLGLRLGFDRGRDEDDADALRGMGDIKARPVLGAFASYRVLPALSVTSGLNYGSGNGRDGLAFDLGLRSQIRLSGAHRVFAGVGATWVNQSSMQSNFGVTAEQAASSGYSIYTPGSGLRDWNLNLGYGYALSTNAALQLGVQWRSLQGDAKDSPLVRAGNGTSINTAFIYRF